MHYYQFNIGDYRRQTSHLTILEHGIYRSLLDTYYLTEKPLCADNAKLMRTHAIRTNEEKEAFNNVISDFFMLTDDGYTHKACEEVIAKYHEKSDKARNSANVRWGKDANAMRTHSERNADGMLTNNHKPITNNQVKKGERKTFSPPTLEEIKEYSDQSGYKVDPDQFRDFYVSKNWMVGKNKMKDWKASVRLWSRRDNNQSSSEDLHKTARLGI